MIIKWITGLAAVAAMVGVVLVVPALPSPSIAAPTPQQIPVEPAVLDVACPGPLAIPVGDIESDDDVLDSGSPDRTYGTYAATPGRAVDAGTAYGEPIAGSLERVADGDIAGLAGLTCTRPARDQWIVAGATSLGASARLVLTNPGPSSVEVTVTLHGPVGAIAEQSIVAVGPDRQRVVLLEGLESEVPATVVHVESTGAGVSAALQDSRLDGFQPAGTDWVAAAVPAERVVIPAVGLAEPLVSLPSADDGTTDDGSGLDLPNPREDLPPPDLSPSGVLRLLAPEGATASLSLVTAEGIQAWQGTRALDLEPGVVVDVEVPLDGLMGIEVEADAPVVAAAMTRVPRVPVEGVAGSLAADLSWVTAQPRTPDATAVVVPPGDAEVIAYAPVGGSFELVDQDGTVVATETMVARTLVRVTVDVPAGTVLTAPEGFVWTLRITDPLGFVTALAPRGVTTADVTVGVVPDSYPAWP